MSWTEILERAVVRLVDAGYERLGKRVQIASIPYTFDAVLLGPAHTLDLVIVIDLTTEAPDRLRQKIDGLGRALDMAGSRRAITAVLVGPQPNPELLDSIGAVCRYLLVSSDEAETGDILEDRLAILLPLEAPAGDNEISDPVHELYRRLPTFADDDERNAIISAASKGEPAVADELRKYVERPLIEET